MSNFTEAEKRYIKMCYNIHREFDAETIDINGVDRLSRSEIKKCINEDLKDDFFRTRT